VKVWIVVIALAIAAPVQAQDADTDTVTESEAASDPPIADPEHRRPRPDYDGREDAPATFGQGLLWAPRILFFPVHVIWEYLVRAPIGWLVTEIERNNLLALLFDFFTWEERKAGLVPTFLFDFGFLPSVGLYFFWNDFPVKNNDVRVWGGFWGVDWLHATVLDRIHLDRDRTTLHLVFDALKRPDFIYNGEGYDILIEDQIARYSRESIQGYALLEHDFWRESRLSLETGVRFYGFFGTDFGHEPDKPEEDQPSVPEAVTSGRYDRYPTSFQEGYTGIYHRIELSLDSRPPRPESGSGVRLHGWGELGYDARDVVSRRWVRYGGVAGLFLDIGYNRLLALSGGLDLVDPLGTERNVDGIPFTELVDINDMPNLVSGFLAGSLRGRSAFTLTLSYTYPIWVWLDGTVHVNVGNVFGEHFGDFDWERMRLFWGIGIRTISERDSAFTLEVAFGTDTLEQGAAISSIRLAFGVVSGF
jgi:hypothetical protein